MLVVHLRVVQIPAAPVIRRERDTPAWVTKLVFNAEYIISNQINDIARSILDKKQVLVNPNLLDGNAGIVTAPHK